MFYTAILLLSLTSQPWESAIYHCDIYPAPNGGFYEQCYWVYPPPDPNPTPCVTDVCSAN